jgi:hypothetical protein
MHGSEVVDSVPRESSAILGRERPCPRMLGRGAFGSGAVAFRLLPLLLGAVNLHCRLSNHCGILFWSIFAFPSRELLAFDAIIRNTPIRRKF